jgi:hypothetical protein
MNIKAGEEKEGDSRHKGYRYGRGNKKHGGQIVCFKSVLPVVWDLEFFRIFKVNLLERTK